MFIFYIISFILGAATASLVFLANRNNTKIDKPDKPKYIRRGIYVNSYSVTSNIDGIKMSPETVEIQFEVGELESTDKKSKIEIISCLANKSRYNTASEKKDFIEMENHKWIDSNKIDWINTVASDRNDKIDKILG